MEFSSSLTRPTNHRATANLGELLKLVTERLVKQGCYRVSIGLAGQSNVVSKLRKSHESSPRIFEHLKLEPLEPPERSWVIQRGVDEIAMKVGEHVQVAPDASKLITEMSDGFPHFLQQFAYSAFAADIDNSVTVHDVLDGAFGESGALQQLGLKYFEDLYFSQIYSDRYREVLQVMANSADGWVAKKEIRQSVEMSEYVLTNAIHTLKKRGIIIPRRGRKGIYRLTKQVIRRMDRCFRQSTSGNQRWQDGRVR